MASYRVAIIFCNFQVMLMWVWRTWLNYCRVAEDWRYKKCQCYLVKLSVSRKSLTVNMIWLKTLEHGLRYGGYYFLSFSRRSEMLRDPLRYLWEALTGSETLWKDLRHSELPLRCSEMLWDSLTISQTIWGTIRHSETLWNALRGSEKQWHVSEMIWDALRHCEAL